jgi:hypothetical protein
VTSRAAVEAAHDSEQDARRVYADAISKAGIARQRARDKAYADRDAAYDVLRSQRGELARIRPRTDEIQDQMAELDLAMASWRASPPQPDMRKADAAYNKAVRAADVALAETLRKIFYLRLRDKVPQ